MSSRGLAHTTLSLSGGWGFGQRTLGMMLGLTHFFTLLLLLKGTLLPGTWLGMRGIEILLRIKPAVRT